MGGPAITPSKAIFFPSLFRLEDTSDQTRGDGSATLTDVESLTSLGSNGVEGLANHLDVVTGHSLLVLVFSRPAERCGFVCGREYKLVMIDLVDSIILGYIPAVRMNICGRYLWVKPLERPPSASVRT